MSDLWSAFAGHVRAHPDADALVLPGATLSFVELHGLAERCAAGLARLGVRKGDVIALHLPKRRIAYALLLACLRIGAPYVFIDPRNPPARTDAILARVQPHVLFARGEAVNPHGAAVGLPDDGDLGWLDGAEDAPAPANVVGSDPAYIMFTSGSTGEPKGAVIPHQGVLSLMSWARDAGIAAEGARFTGINPVHFDNSVFDIYCGLLNGHALAPVETSEMANPAHWLRRVREAGATVMFAVPTLFLLLDQLGLLTPESLPGVTTFVFGGEGFPIGALRRFKQRFGDRARLINVYGPTETSCICSSIVIDDAALAGADDSFPSLGRMHREFTHAVLDEDGRDVPRGTAGELWIGGPNVGLGYFRNEAETRKRFRQDPRQDGYRAIYYRSGDLVQEDADGRLWFKGRADNQVKIRGHRIELEEVDLAVQAIAGVRRALAAVLDGPDGPEIGLIYAADAAVTEAVVAEACAARLPTYMRPAQVRRVPEIPVNANGKADRRAVRAALAAEAVP